MPISWLAIFKNGKPDPNAPGGIVSKEAGSKALAVKPQGLRVQAWKRWSADLFRALLDLAIPRECPICKGDGEDDDPDIPGSIGSPFCLACRAELLDAATACCELCAMPIGPYVDPNEPCRNCRGKGLGFQKALALGPYSGPIRDLVLEMKHLQGAWIGRWLTSILIEARPELGRLARADPRMLVVPVPLHWRREWSRGYNQADELAQSLSKGLGLEKAEVLSRVSSSKILAGLSRADRKKALGEAFRCKRSAASKIHGRTILLVDDVLTTGATASAAARALRKAGAFQVILTVIGRAEGKTRA